MSSSIKNFSDSPWSYTYTRFKTDPSYASHRTLSELSVLVSRVIGEKWMPYFIFELKTIPSSEGRDAYEICGDNGRIRISGPNGVSLASGFNYYLKNYVSVNYNPIFGGNTRMPDKLPSVNGTVVKKTPYDIRYALNFCTYAYTMAFWM